VEQVGHAQFAAAQIEGRPGNEVKSGNVSVAREAAADERREAEKAGAEQEQR